MGTNALHIAVFPGDGIGREVVEPAIELFIRRARELGFSLEEIRELSGLASGHRLTCHAVKALTEQHIADIRRKVKDLRRLERVLNDLASRCHGNEMPDCPILETLGDRGVVSNVSV